MKAAVDPGAHPHNSTPGVVRIMIVVTGGAGFIGSNLVAALGERRFHDIAVIDRLRNNDKWRSLRKHEVSVIVSPEQLFPFLAASRTKVGVIFHMEAISSTTETDADLILHTNFALSQHIWTWRAENDVRLIYYASSAATYTDGPSICSIVGWCVKSKPDVSLRRSGVA